jgi:hypothetical protein
MTPRLLVEKYSPGYPTMITWSPPAGGTITTAAGLSKNAGRSAETYFAEAWTELHTSSGGIVSAHVHHYHVLD